MKIDNLVIPHTRLMHLDYGDTFRLVDPSDYGFDGIDLFLKVNDSSASEALAVNLATGYLVSFESATRVLLVKTKVVMDN